MNNGTDIKEVDFNLYYRHLSKCLICGSEFHQLRKGKPRDYCNDNCRDFNKFKNALERTILKINFKDSYSNQAKGDIFSIANLIKITRK